MATNPYFRHHNATNEQDLYHDLATEMVQMAGIDVHYIKVDSINSKNFDTILGENRFESLKDSIVIEAYLKEFEQPYAGDDFYAKFGLSQPHTCTLIVGVRRAHDLLGSRPREGDYIYIPKFEFLGPDDIFRIHKVDATDVQWKALGSPVYYFLKCERAKFSHQEVETGIGDLDMDVDMKERPDGDRNNDNDPLQDLTDMLVDFSEENIFGRP